MDPSTAGQLRVIRKVVTVTGAADIPAWLFGGWGLDARIGRITREHGDVELWVERIHAERSKAVLVGAGATALTTQPPEEACEFTWDDVPLSTAYFDRQPDGSFSQPLGRWSDWLFPPGSFGDEPGPLDGTPVLVKRARDGTTWRIGTDAEVAWIANGTSPGRTITAAIPPLFEAYATVPLGYGEERDVHDRALLTLLREQSPGQRWWLGYLDTGVDDIVFPDAPKVTLHYGWHYVLVQAGPDQAAAWRPSDGRAFGTGDLPNLMFPADRSWLVSTLWDDDWSCIGGPAGLVDRVLRHPDLQARSVALGQDATPPGHEMR